MRQTVILVGLWLAIFGLLFGVFVFDLDDWATEKISQIDEALTPNECAGMPEPYLARCEQDRETFGEVFHRPVYNSQQLKNFPNLVDKYGWKGLGEEFFTGPLVLHSELVGFSFDLRDSERAVVDADAMWYYFEYRFSCSTSFPRAVIYARDGTKLDDVSIYYFLPAGKLDGTDEFGDLPIDMTLTPWPDMQDLKAYQQEARDYDKSAMEEDSSIKRWRDIEFLEAPRSLAAETGIEEIVTYAFRISFINNAGVVEVSSTNRVIVVPYRDGNLQMVSMITRFDDSKPDPKGWQHLWRILKLEDGSPTGKSIMTEEGEVVPYRSLADFMYENSHCQKVHELPPRWAWPKDLPRYWEE